MVRVYAEDIVTGEIIVPVKRRRLVRYVETFSEHRYGKWVLAAIAFVDSGVVRVYKNIFETGENSATLSGAGVGLNWVGPHRWAVSGSLAAPIGRAPILTGDTASSRLWIEIHKAFTGSPVSR